MYLPPAFFWWWYHFDAYAPAIFLEGAAIAASGGFGAIGIAIWHVGVARPGSQGGHDLWLGALGHAGGDSFRRAAAPVTGSCSADTPAIICVTTVPSTSFASPRPVPGRG